MKVVQKIEDFQAVVFRTPAKPISSFLIKHTNVTPNQVSMIGIPFVILGGLFFILGDHRSLIFGAVSIFLYTLTDAIDGDIARTKKTGSKLGQWLDAVIGWITIEILFFALMVGINTKIAFIFGALAMICFPLHFLFIHYYKSEIVGTNEAIPIGKSGKLDFIRYLYGDTLFFIFLPIACILNRPIYCLMFFAIFGNLFWMGILIVQYLSLREKK